MSTNSIQAVTTTDEIVVRTKPSIREIAAATTMNVGPNGELGSEVWRPVVEGDKVAYFDGIDTAYHVVTKGEMVKVERFRARADKQRAHERAQSDRELAQMRREDKRAQREATAARQAEAARRSALHAEAVARIAAASK